MSPQQHLDRIQRLEERLRSLQYHVGRATEAITGIEFDLGELRRHAQMDRLEEQATHVDPHPGVRA